MWPGQSHLSSRILWQKRGLIVKNKKSAALNFAAVGAKTMLSFHVKLDKGRLVGRSNRPSTFVADVLCILLNVPVFLGIAHFCLLLDFCPPPLCGDNSLFIDYKAEFVPNSPMGRIFWRGFVFLWETRSRLTNLGVVFRSAQSQRHNAEFAAGSLWQRPATL